jgi:predicted metal-dependent phosphoesterase TrpH
MSEKKLFDLHCHTTCSDGSVEPQELLRLAKEKGLLGLSITDHDTIEAYNHVESLANELQIDLISGVEFSSHFNDVSIHILAYAFSINNPEILNFCSKHLLRRRERNLMILEKLKKNNIFIEEEDLVINAKNAPICVGRPHIAHAMVKKGYVLSINDAFNRYIGEDGPCYHAGPRFSVEETLDVIKKAGGLAVIAHPHLIHNSKVEEALIDLPFDGIEVFYARFTEGQNNKWLQVALKKDLLVTGGSDFHGLAKPHISLGISSAPYETFEFLKKHYKNESIIR